MEHSNRLRSDVNDGLNKVDALLESLAKNSTIKGVTGNEIARMQAVAESTRKRMNEQNLTVAVMALMKSGKSTFLNSMLGDNLLPVHSEACTARICQINHKQLVGDEQPVLTETDVMSNASRTVAEGSADILQYLTQLNHTERDNKGDSTEQVVTITAQFAALVDGVSGISTGTGMSVMDTPGPNEAGADFLKQKVERLLAEMDAVIYLLDYTKIGSTDEQEIFDNMKKTNATLLKRLSGRLFFVVNKVDTSKFCTGASIEQCRKSVAERVTKAIDLPDFVLKPEQVLCVSAHEALLGRLCLRGKLNDEQKQQLHERTFPTFDVEDIEPELYVKAAKKLFLKSGMPELEQAVLSYLYSKRVSINLLALTDDLTGLMKQVSNFCTIQKSLLGQNMQSLEQTAEAMRKRLEVTVRKFDDVKIQAHDIVETVTFQVEETFRDFDHGIQESLDQVFEGVKKPRNGFAQAFNEFKKVKDFFTNGSSAGDIVVKGPKAAVFAGNTRAALQAIESSLIQAVLIFFGSLEDRLQSQQEKLFETVNIMLKKLSADIQGDIEDAVNIKLHAVGKLQLKNQDAEAFHESLQAILHGGAKASTETQVRVDERMQKKEVSGACGRKKTVEQMVKVDVPFDVEVVTVNPQEIKAQYAQKVHEMAQVSIGNTQKVVSIFLRRRIAALEKEMHAVCKRFQDHVSAAITLKDQDESLAQKALEEVTAGLNTVGGLLDTFDSLGSRLNAELKEMNSSSP